MDAAGRHFVDHLRLAGRQAQHVPVLEVTACGTCSERARRAWALMWRSSPCTGTAILRPGPAVHLRQLVARGMAGDVDEMILGRQHFHAQRRPACCAARRSRSSLPGMMREEKITVSPWPRLTLRCSPSAMRASAARGLALAAGAEIEHAMRRQIGGLFLVEHGGKIREIARGARRLDHLLHGAADQRDLRPCSARGLGDGIQPRDIGGEAR